ncbi:hypothetical protein GCM10023197_24260 [Gordonia humi]
MTSTFGASPDRGPADVGGAEFVGSSLLVSDEQPVRTTAQIAMVATAGAAQRFIRDGAVHVSDFTPRYPSGHLTESVGFSTQYLSIE